MKQSKRGFTIVELVIVIAVIAVLAAVLIPTFSSLIKKANLNSDMQAVREMNLALASDEALNGKPQDIEKVMDILMRAGYNADNWQTLTSGYEVYWYREANRLVLYSSSTLDVVYPEEYVGYFTNTRNKDGEVIRHFELYNQNVKNALEVETSLSSSKTGGKTISELSSSTSTQSEVKALESVDSAVSNNTSLRSSLGIDAGENVYVNASHEVTSGDVAQGNYASMQVLSISDTKQELTSSGDIEANLLYISVNTAAGASNAQIATAQKAASEYVYAAFTQINTGKLSENVNIVLNAGVVLDASSHEWKPVKQYSGYMGGESATNPSIIKGARLTSSTSYSETISFDGSGGKYFVTGFVGALYGDAVFENITFKETSIVEPASDFDMALSAKSHSRNSVGIIGGVVDIPDQKGADQFKQASNVVVRNIVVENTVRITGVATAAGLISYVGGSGDGRAVYNGSLLIDNCKVSADVQISTDTTKFKPEWGAYGPCGGLIGFSCRACESGDKDGDGVSNETYNIIIKDCTFDGHVKGYRAIGAAVGNIQNGMYVFEGTNDFSNANLDTSMMTLKSDNAENTNTEKSLVGVIGTCGGTQSIVYFTGSISLKEGMAYFGGNTFAAQVTTKTNVTPSYTKFDTVSIALTDGAEATNVGANNGIWG